MGIKIGLIKNSEKELLREIAEANPDQNSLWRIPNLWIPFGAIILTLIILLAFSERRSDPILYFSAILNGSLPLIAINQISGIGLHIFKFDKAKEQGLEIGDTLVLRTKLLYYSIAILILGVIVYASQVVNSPFSNYALIVILLLISGVLIWWSTFVSKKIFLLQEQFLENTFDSEIRSNANDIKKNWDK